MSVYIIQSLEFHVCYGFGFFVFFLFFLFFSFLGSRDESELSPKGGGGFEGGLSCEE